MMLALNPPHSPLSEVTTTRIVRGPGALGEQGMGVGQRARGDVPEHLGHLPGIGARREHGLLGSPELRCRDHLHGLGDLLRALHAPDPTADVDQRWHRLLASSLRIRRHPCASRGMDPRSAQGEPSLGKRHGLGDLLRALHAPDPTADVDQRWHRLLASSLRIRRHPCASRGMDPRSAQGEPSLGRRHGLGDPLRALHAPDPTADVDQCWHRLPSRNPTTPLRAGRRPRTRRGRPSVSR